MGVYDIYGGMVPHRHAIHSLEVAGPGLCCHCLSLDSLRFSHDLVWVLLLSSYVASSGCFPSACSSALIPPLLRSVLPGSVVSRCNPCDAPRLEPRPCVAPRTKPLAGCVEVLIHLYVCVCIHGRHVGCTSINPSTGGSVCCWICGSVSDSVCF